MACEKLGIPASSFNVNLILPVNLQRGVEISTGRIFELSLPFVNARFDQASNGSKEEDEVR